MATDGGGRLMMSSGQTNQNHATTIDATLNDCPLLQQGLPSAQSTDDWPAPLSRPTESTSASGDSGVNRSGQGTVGAVSERRGFGHKGYSPHRLPHPPTRGSSPPEQRTESTAAYCPTVKAGKIRNDQKHQYATNDCPLLQQGLPSAQPSESTSSGWPAPLIQPAGSTSAYGWSAAKYHATNNQNSSNLPQQS